MDTSAKVLIEELNDILNDFKMEIMEETGGLLMKSHPKPNKAPFIEFEKKIDFLIKEVNELFDSSYSFNK